MTSKSGGTEKPPTDIAELRCAACFKYLGGNNEQIKDGPHAGARPTDLTIHCELTGRQERVMLYNPISVANNIERARQPSAAEVRLREEEERVRKWAEGNAYKAPPMLNPIAPYVLHTDAREANCTKCRELKTVRTLDGPHTIQRLCSECFREFHGNYERAQ